MNKPVTKFSFENNIFDIIRYYAMHASHDKPHGRAF